MQVDFQKTNTLFDVDSCIKPNKKPEETHLKVIALDFDATLAKSKAYLGSEDWYKFVTEACKKTTDLHYDAHYHWAIKVREVVPYESCEDAKEIAQLIEKWRNDQWRVVILTSRKYDMLSVTLQHIEQSGLPFSKEDIILKPGSGKQKNEFFHEWVQKELGGSNKKLTVRFVDDTLDHCKAMAKLENAKVKCFHYTKHSSSAAIDQPLLETLSIQLAHYKSRNFSSYLNKAEMDLDKALQILEIEKLSEENIFSTMQKLASDEGAKFMTKEEYIVAKAKGLI